MTRRLSTTAAMLLVTMLTVAAAADQVKRDGFWIPNVIINDIQESKLLYTNNAGTAFEPNLSEVQGIELDNNPNMRAGHDAVEANDWQTAATKFEAARAAAVEKWAQAWADAQLVIAYDKLGDARKATTKYLALVRAGADAHFLSAPPLTSLTAADEATKARIKPTIEAAQAAAGNGAVGEALKQMLALAGGGTAQQQREAATAVAEANRQPGDDLPAEAAIAMPNAIDEFKDDPIVRDLWLGRFQDALEKAQRELASPTRRLSMVLYLQGVAQLGLADAGNNEKLYKDAALSFMRVAIHFPRSPWVAASRLETAYVHLKINRPVIARQQIDLARNLIDAEEDPAYAARLDQLLQALPPAVE